MRDIKFRAWDAQSNEWMYAGLKNGIRSFPLTVSNPLSLCLDDRFGDKYENTVWCLSNDELIWCQYTGLLDKNGVEIYEGDIIKLGEIYNKINIGTVVFNEDDFGVPCFCIQEDKYLYQTFFYQGDNPRIWFEVIGNIYENKELLGDNKIEHSTKNRRTIKNRTKTNLRKI